MLPALLFACLPAGAAADHAYGAAPLQTLDFWRPAASTPAPLIVFVHGGGWKRGDKTSATGADKVAHFTDAGYAFASINYRLVPGASVEQQAADVASSLSWLKDHAAPMGIDPARIVLMGHSAGAHLVALVGTDPRYLAAAGLTLADLRGVIALDGAAYDVARQVDAAGPLMRRTYAEAFGTDPLRQRALSPTLQAAAPNAPAFLLLHVDRADGKVQAEGLAGALAQAGTQVDVKSVGGSGLRGHMDLNTSLGSASYPATALVDDWLRKLLRSR
ncbi:alpha/beta hydrolase [Massilia sp. S19_KUP03_FR1]|uniref:alpha/beta hydrolase n=1 Tax=Massilia sp. S19_KUP03_FR1 TaxID=3025503 RepID=UPI002FCD7C11